ncbi:Thiol:disulfide interchange protein DsbD [Sodalis praecaptivus]
MLPCTTAPLSAILLYIAQSGNLWFGGFTLWLYAVGMGIPLVLVALFGHRMLPKSGPWMQQVKQGFGFVILALPVFLLERILGDNWGRGYGASWRSRFSAGDLCYACKPAAAAACWRCCCLA